ncbi:MAG TPA: MerR family transcriptional regulator [Steroidobacteraceae bacterium]|nr:MerR family transcriptional regulator [Steroidobacteraceae bacterium]
MGLRTIGQLAKASGLPVDTIRYYERVGLLPRRASGRGSWRRYPDEMLARLRYVREGRAVGFTIGELRDLLRLTIVGAPRFCDNFDVAVRRKVEAIEQVISRLSSQRARLEEFSRSCRERRREHRCPILENLRPRPPLSD